MKGPGTRKPDGRPPWERPAGPGPAWQLLRGSQMTISLERSHAIVRLPAPLALPRPAPFLPKGEAGLGRPSDGCCCAAETREQRLRFPGAIKLLVSRRGPGGRGLRGKEDPGAAFPAPSQFLPADPRPCRRRRHCERRLHAERAKERARENA